MKQNSEITREYKLRWNYYKVKPFSKEISFNQQKVKVHQRDKRGH